MTPCAAKCAACWLRPALPIDGGARHVLGPAGGQHGIAADVGGLLAHLHDAAHDDVVDERRVEAGAVDQCLHRLGGQVDRMPVLQLAVATAERRADGIDDDCGGHGQQSAVRRVGHLKPERPQRSNQPATPRLGDACENGRCPPPPSPRSTRSSPAPRHRQCFVTLVDAHPDVPALHSMQRRRARAVERVDRCRVRPTGGQAAAGLRHARRGAGDRVLLMMRNRPDFHWFDLAAQFLRATPVSIYNSSSPEEIEYLAHHAEAEWRSSRTPGTSSGC